MQSKKEEIEQHLRAILGLIGDNPDRAGLLGTPDRVRRMYQEIYRGYDPDQAPKVTTFQNGADGITYDQMVFDSGTFYSTCEHHMMPFFGRYVFAYIPSKQGRILGLSKVARVVDYCSAKLQIQERLGQDIVAMLTDALTKDGAEPPLGMAVYLEGEHMCKSMRGVKKPGKMVTTCLQGHFLDSSTVRSEFLAGCSSLMGR